MNRFVAIALVLVPALASATPKPKPMPAPADPATPGASPGPSPGPSPGAESPSSSAGKPWADGVAEDVQKRASALYEEGNTLFAQQAHAPALEKYRAAVALWDHPLIQFNLAVTLVRLDRILEAADALEKALRYQDAPFKPELYQQALDYQRLLAGRVGHLEASCDRTAANVLLDGKRWFDCPGSQTTRVMAGEHTLVGEREGYITSSQRVVVVGGATAHGHIKLVAVDSAVLLEYPYRRWIPWTITAVGAAIGLGGAAFWFAGKNQMNDFDNNFAGECTMTGCEKDLSKHPALRDQRDGARFKGTVGITMMIAGGTATIAGVVLAIVNRPHRVLPTVEIAPTAGGVQGTVGWSF